MTFSAEQKHYLAAPLSRDVVKTRKQGNRQVSYIEGWHAIAECNRIFGFDQWTRETVDVKCVAEVERKIGVSENFAGYDGWGVTYICRVRVTVLPGGELSVITREGCGAGHGIDRDIGQAHESALKEAETDAMKRALMTFGNAFGLALYDKTQANVADDEPEPPPPQQRAQAEIDATHRYIEGCKQTIAEFTDVTKMMNWWNSDAQRTARRKYLSEGEMEVLKALVISKIPKEADERS